MREHLGIGLGNELGVSVADQLILERLEILDDTVVDQGKAAGRVEVRMSVLIGRFPVRGPASMTDAEGPRRRAFGH